MDVVSELFRPLLRHFVIIFILFSFYTSSRFHFGVGIFSSSYTLARNVIHFSSGLSSATHIQTYKIVENIWISMSLSLFVNTTVFSFSSHFCLLLSFQFGNIFVSLPSHFFRRPIRKKHQKMNGWILRRIQFSHRMVIVFYCWRAFKRLVLNISLISSMLQ